MFSFLLALVSILSNCILYFSKQTQSIYEERHAVSFEGHSGRPSTKELFYGIPCFHMGRGGKVDG